MFQMTIEFKVGRTKIDEHGHVNHAYHYMMYQKGRQSLLHLAGLDTESLRRDYNLGLFVVHTEADYKKQLFKDDVVLIHTKIADIGRTSITFDQAITVGDYDIASTGKIVQVLTNANGQPEPINDELRRMLMEYS